MHSQITPIAGELRLAVLILLVFPLAASATLAQSAFVPPLTNYGGHLVKEMVPYQPEVPFQSEVVGSVSPLDQTPIYLDTCPEFCHSGRFEEAKSQAMVQVPAGSRDGLFQKFFFTGTWIPQLDDASLGFSTLEAGIVFGLPFPRDTTPLLITPRFAVHYLDGPTTPDLPARVFDAEVTFRHLRKFGSGPWSMDASITLGHYSDFESSDADAFRVSGHALAVYESSPATKWVFGAAYLNRQNLSVIPIVGAIYEPTPDLKCEAILSRPRIAWRLLGGQRWAYLAAEFGGGIWSFERPLTGTQDLLTYNDYRVLVGIERKAAGGLSRRIEVGYVFGRKLEFASTTPDVRLDDSLFVRGGLTY